MVYRVYVEKKKGLDNEAAALKNDIFLLLGIKELTELRIFNCYDCENMDASLFDYACRTVFSEPQLDHICNTLPDFEDASIFAVEYLPGQFDMRADSAAQCIQIISQGERPIVRTSRIYVLHGCLSGEDIDRIKKYVINPVEAREASLKKPATLKVHYQIPAKVAVVEGFLKLEDRGLGQLVGDMGLAMDLDDIRFCRDYFRGEKREPTVTEIKMIDTYWSDHCRHTTFLTEIDRVTFEDELLQTAYEEYTGIRKKLGDSKPVCLMDIGTLAAKYLRSEGKLDKLDESEEINACTVKIEVETEGRKEKWLLLFKNETHNHPTEIEPFGGAATCIGGAIRDPLSGRSYVYAAMRVSGAGDPTRPLEETLRGKLPQRKLVTTAAAGYSSYGNQIGLATGLVDEIYHQGYTAKHMEIGAVIAAAPEKNVRRERPAEGDVILLLGGRTGRDGCGGATGSSKAHNLDSLENCGAEVQKGNAPEERKLQRLFRNREASLLIKRCNDFGAGGVSVAIGELADGIEINLDQVPKKYEGLDGTELAISESQERMAVVVSKEDAARFCELAAAENLEATEVACVRSQPRLKMNWNGTTIVDISREFLDSNGAQKHIAIAPEAPKDYHQKIQGGFAENYQKTVSDLNICSRKGLSERFDSTIGAGTVLMPFGGENQLTPIQAMVHKISLEHGDTDTVSFMSWGYNPLIAEKSPYHGAYLAVVESVSKLIAAGAKFEEVYLTFQEYFEKPMRDQRRWGKPLAALLGAFKAQLELGIAAIGGKDSMSGSFEHLDVPPTLVSFAVTTDKLCHVISPEFKKEGHRVVIIKPDYDKDRLPVTKSLLANFERVSSLIRSGKVLSVYTPTMGGVAEAIFKMAIGNNIGFQYESNLTLEDIFGYNYGSFILELAENEDIGQTLGYTCDKGIGYREYSLELNQLLKAYEERLEDVYHCNIKTDGGMPENFAYTASGYPVPAKRVLKPKAIIPVFPGTNCEYDTAKALRKAGAEAEIIVINNLTAAGIADSAAYFAREVKKAQMIIIPGGFSGGDEPDGSGKFITAFFRNAAVKAQVNELMNNRDGLMLGICNGFQALIKLGLVPYGEIIDVDEDCPTLTYNTIARHQSKLVRTRIASNKSPWLAHTKPGDIYTVPVSHGEGRFIASQELIKELAANGQIATQYCDFSGNASYEVGHNPNNSICAIEGITSPDGRVLGKMGHSERIGEGLYKNVAGRYEMSLFDAAVEYFK